jgi:hypothetical protein
MTEDLSGISPRRPALLEFSSMPAERRLLAMRRKVLPGALDALGQRAERLMWWKKAEG